MSGLLPAAAIVAGSLTTALLVGATFYMLASAGQPRTTPVHQQDVLFDGEVE